MIQPIDEDRPRAERRTAVRPWIPADARSVPRTQLVNGFTSLTDTTVVVVSGPAGSGKSTLAGQWEAADDRPHLSITIGPQHANPAVLSRDVVAALAALGPAVRGARGLASVAQPAFSTQVLPAMTAIARTRESDYVLVIDDVHLLTDPRAPMVLMAVADGIPGGSQLVLLTRETTPTWLGDARAAGRLFEIGPDDLSFSEGEAGLMFAQMGVDVDAGYVRDATAQTEGWAVGLYLSALSRADRRRGPLFLVAPPRGSDRLIHDYLRGEVLDALEPQVREFLMHASVLEELNPALCDAVLDRGDSGLLLRQAHEGSSLVIAAENERVEYRLHHLLRDALRAELAERDSRQVPILHSRASDWFRLEGDLDAAIRHAKSSGDMAHVGDLVWSGILGCIGSGRPDRLQAWLNGLSDAGISSDRWLSLAAAWSALQSGDLAGRDRWTLVSERHAGRNWRAEVSQDDYAASLATLLALVGRDGLSDSVVLAEGALAGLPADSGFRAAAAFLRGVGLTLQRQFESGRVGLTEAKRFGTALDVPLIEADADAWLGLLAVMAGDISGGAAVIAQSAAILEEHDLERLATAAHTITAVALAQALRQETPQAQASLAKARRMMALVTGIAPWFEVTGRCIQARTAAMLGDGPLARQLVTEARAQMTAELAATLAAELLADADEALRNLAIDGVGGPALTAAEMRVLQFLPSHLTFPQIGEHLFLSSNTVKTHALAIYRKLSVSSRDEAVVRARALGLVEGPVR